MRRRRSAAGDIGGRNGLRCGSGFPGRCEDEFVEGFEGTDAKVLIGIGVGLAALLVVDGCGFEGPDAGESPAHVRFWGACYAQLIQITFL